MSQHEEAMTLAVKAAAAALSEYYEGDGWGYFGGAAEAAVAAAAPILLAAERARIVERCGVLHGSIYVLCGDCLAETAPEEGP